MPSDNSDLWRQSVFYNSRRDDLLNDSSIKLPFQKIVFKTLPFLFVDFKYLCTLCFSCFLCCVPRKDSSLKQVSCILRVKWSIYPLSSVAQSCTTLCDRMDCNSQASLSIWVRFACECPASPAEAWVDCGLLLLGALPQCGLRPNNREGTQSCSPAENCIKSYWAWPRPLEQDPDSPAVSLSH